MYSYANDYMKKSNIKFITIINISFEDKKCVVNYIGNESYSQYINIDDFGEYIKIESRKKKLNSL